MSRCFPIVHFSIYLLTAVLFTYSFYPGTVAAKGSILFTSSMFGVVVVVGGYVGRVCVCVCVCGGGVNDMFCPNIQMK